MCKTPSPSGGAGTTTNVLDGAQLQLQGGINVSTQNLVLSGAGDGTGALLNVSGNNSWGSAARQHSPWRPIRALRPQSTPAGVVTFGVANLADTLTLNGAIAEQPAQTQALPASPPASFATGLVKVGLGTLDLAQADTYSGSTYVQSGVLDVQNSNALGLDAGQAVQRVTTFDPGAADSFVLNYGVVPSASLNFASTAAQVQTALDAVVPGGVHVEENIVYSGLSSANADVEQRDHQPHAIHRHHRRRAFGADLHGDGRRHRRRYRPAHRRPRRAGDPAGGATP